MDKKDIYEHLAKIYLDASSKRKRKGKFHSRLSRGLIVGGSAVLSCLIIFFIHASIVRNNSLHSETALVLMPDAAKINFNFDPARKEIYSIDLNQLNLNRFKALAFSVKKSNYQDNISLRVEFNSAFKEISEVYLKDISHKWQDYKINLSDFKNISDWSNISTLAFIVEEWNAKDNQDVIYIDNIRFLR